MSEHNDNRKKAQEQALKVITVFSGQQTLFGLPSNVTGLGIAVTLILFFILSKVVAIIFAVFYFAVMFRIHENDPKGFEVWRSVIVRRTSGWSGGEVKPTTLIVLHKK